MNVEKLVPGVKITLGGKERTLVFDMWAFMLLEKETGKSALGGEIFNKVSATDLTVLAWAALQAESEISLKEVAKMMTLKDIEPLSKAIQTAFEQAKPAENPELKKDPAAEEEKPL